MRPFIFLFSILVLFACKKETVAATATEQATIVSVLKSCAGRTVGSSTVTVCLDSVISDSRCPRNTQCAWAGTVMAAFTVTANGQTHHLKLATFGVPDFPKDTVVAGHRFSFDDLTPYPGDPLTDFVRSTVTVTRQ